MTGCHHNNPLVGYFGIEKTQELVTRNYFWPTLCHNVKIYFQRCNIYLASQTVCYKLYRDLQSLLVPTHCWKNLSIDFVTGLLLFADWKSDSYNTILVVINCLTKMVYYKLVKVIINTPRLANIIIEVMVQHHSLFDSIISD